MWQHKTLNKRLVLVLFNEIFTTLYQTDDLTKHVNWTSWRQVMCCFGRKYRNLATMLEKSERLVHLLNRTVERNAHEDFIVNMRFNLWSVWSFRSVITWARDQKHSNIDQFSLENRWNSSRFDVKYVNQPKTNS